MTQGACYGAALLAGVGAGVYRQCGRKPANGPCARPEAPGPGRKRARTSIPIDRYRALYPALAPEFKRGAHREG